MNINPSNQSFQAIVSNQLPWEKSIYGALSANTKEFAPSDLEALKSRQEEALAATELEALAASELQP